MDQREYLNDFEEALLVAFEGMQAGLWTGMPAIIESFDAARQMCSAKIAVQAQVTNQDGTKSWANIPLVSDILVVFPSGGGYTLTFPLAKGDEIFVAFANRCIDNWWQLGDVQPQAELRMHDLSDGFAFPGPRSKPRTLAGVSTSSVQLRTDDGAAFIEISGHSINIITPGAVSVNAETATITAPDVTIKAESSVTMDTPLLKVSGDIVDNYVNGNSRSIGEMRSIYNNHTHTDPQGGNTGGPSGTM